MVGTAEPLNSVAILLSSGTSMLRAEADCFILLESFLPTL